MTKQEALDTLSDARRDWLALVTSIPVHRREEVGVHPKWSLKDVVAHVSWHEREIAGVLQQRRLVGSPWWELPTHERNEHIYAQFRDATWDEIWDLAQDSYNQLVRQLERVTDADLEDPARFADWPPEWKPWQLVAQNSWEHYRDHGAAISRWLASSGKARPAGESVAED